MDERNNVVNILIHGAINGSNFGDCIFAHIFYESLSKKGTVDFVKMPKFGLCDYLSKEILEYTPSFNKIKEADCLVYMSGGYFGDTTNSWREAVKRYFRYFRIAEHFIKCNKPIYICGIGGGPVNNGFLRNKIVRILNKAQFVSVRDQETADYFYQNGVKRTILVTTDSALSIKNRKLPALDSKINVLTHDKKNIFFHVYGSDKSNKELADKILPALNRFLDDHSGEYRVFVGTDNISRNKIKELDIFRNLIGDKVAVDYTCTWGMCSLLKNMDTAITVKLHVGIISALYEKSVISFPRHINKTKRFYNQIGFSERCMLLKDINIEGVYSMLCKFMDKKISIDPELVEKSNINLQPIVEKGE